MTENRCLPRGPVPTALFVALAAAGSAQEPDAAPSKTLEQELAELRDDYGDLVLRLSDLEERDAARGDDEEGGDGLYFQTEDVHGTFLIFGDVQARYQNPDVDDSNSEFFMGALAVLGNVNFGEHVRVLSETVVETDHVGQERLWGQYSVDDRLYFKLGTEHAPTSRWNYEFHHGAWLETSITRPIMDRFEGDGGILPMHRTGLETGGTLFTGGGSLQYFVTVSNGRGEAPDDKQREGDANDSKAIDLGISYSPADSPDLSFGGALTFDEIPEDGAVADPDRGRDMTEWVATAHFSSGLGPLFLRSEYAFIQHEGRVTGSEYTHNAAFVQLELPGERWTPYARSGYRNMEEGDPFYRPMDRDLDEWRQVLGVRNDMHSNVAIKFEVSYGRVDERDGGDVSGDDVTTAAIQLSWYF